MRDEKPDERANMSFKKNLQYLRGSRNMTQEQVIREVMLDRQPSRAFVTVEQIGGTTVWLCSGYADQVTGTTISVDGGWTAL